VSSCKGRLSPAQACRSQSYSGYGYWLNARYSPQSAQTAHMPGKRPYHQKSTNKFLLFAADTRFGWRVIRRVTFRLGEAKVTEWKWREILDPFKTHIGYQVISKIKPARDRRYRPLPTAITAKDAKLISGLFGTSRTAGLSEDRRLTRHARYDEDKILAPEDAIERAQEKVKQWPFPASRIDSGKRNSVPAFGDRATRVYPKPA
jgi:hypothetical protein